MPDEAAEPAGTGPEVPPGVRAQLLATEHWSLLASRTTTQGEVLTRISIFLTLTSAGLVSLALAGQATRFNGAFPGFALTVLGIIFVIGFLTQIRVLNVSMEDLAFVLVMNRLRAAYVELDPGVTPYLMASRFDDRAGSIQTYYFIGRRGSSQVAGSSMVFIVAVNAALLGLFLAGIVALAWASPGGHRHRPTVRPRIPRRVDLDRCPALFPIPEDLLAAVPVAGLRLVNRADAVSPVQ